MQRSCFSTLFLGAAVCSAVWVSSASAHMDERDYHPMCPGQTVFVNNLAGCEWCLAHGAMMFLAYGVFMLFGMFTSRYLKPYAAWWFPLHILLMLTAFFIATPSFAIAIDIMPGLPVPFVDGGASDMIMNVHHILGYITYSLMALQIILGATSHFMFNPDRKSTPWIPDRTHWYIGWLTLLLAFVTMYIALFMMNAPRNYAIIFGVYLAIIFAWIVVMEIFCYIWPPVSKHHASVTKMDSLDREGTKLSQQNTYDDEENADPDDPARVSLVNS